MTLEQFFSFGWLTPGSCTRAIIKEFVKRQAPKNIAECEKYLCKNIQLFGKVFVWRHGFWLSQKRIREEVEDFLGNPRVIAELQQELKTLHDEQCRRQPVITKTVIQGRFQQRKTLQRVRGGR